MSGGKEDERSWLRREKMGGRKRGKRTDGAKRMRNKGGEGGGGRMVGMVKDKKRKEGRRMT